MADPPSDNPAPLAPTTRRGSWARAFDRVRAAMKKRSSSTSKPLHTVSQQVPPRQEPATDTLGPSNATPRIPDDNEATDTTIAPPTVPAAPLMSEPLIDADHSIDADDGADNDDDSIVPTFSTRTAISDERARDLFAKYNIKYDPRGKRPQQEPSNKIRRVEKPVRLRVHWTCHECRSQFGMDKVCTNCGHRRCRECVRHPPKRARPVSDINREQVQVEQEPVQEAAQQSPLNEEATAVDPDLQSYREEPAAGPQSRPEEGDASPKGTPRTSAQAATAGEPSSSQPLEIDDDAAADYANLRSAQYTIYSRPRAAIHSILPSTTKSTRRTCHECDTPMLPTRRRNCPNCGHVECHLCTPSNSRQDAGPSTQEPGEEVPMFKAVKRVYRKPRQRVRYRCEHCNTHFVESDRCIECGHERCQTCHREPPKRHHPSHDPEILAAVANRLAAYGGGLGQPAGIAASG